MQKNELSPLYGQCIDLSIFLISKCVLLRTQKIASLQTFFSSFYFLLLLMSPCLTYAIHYLGKYPKTVHDMIAQLKKKWFPQEEIEEAIPLLIENNYLNDMQYAESYLHSEVVRKGKPLLLIKQKLIMKWVDKTLVNELIGSIENELIEWQSSKILKEIERLRTKGKSDPEIAQALTRKGFGRDEVRKAIKNS